MQKQYWLTEREKKRLLKVARDLTTDALTLPGCKRCIYKTNLQRRCAKTLRAIAANLQRVEIQSDPLAP